MSYDIEDFHDFVASTLKNNIDAQIDAINADKNDEYVLQKPTANDYYTDLDAQVISKHFFIYYTVIEARPVQNIGEDVSMEVTMLIYVAFMEVDRGEKAMRRGMRYTKALQNIFKDAFKTNAHVSDLEIFQHFPQSAQFEKSSKWYKIGGIEIKGTIST